MLIPTDAMSTRLEAAVDDSEFDSIGGIVLKELLHNLPPAR